MRLVCPNCAAVYEVADEAIPQNGRDVQCAECGDTWFQEKRPSLRKPVAPQVRVPAMEDDDEDDAEEAALPRTGLRASEGATGQDNDLDEDDDEGDAAPVFSSRHRDTKGKVDPSVLDILRSEAERETAAREADDKGHTAPAPQIDATGEDADEDPEALAQRARDVRERLTAARNRGSRITFAGDKDETPDRGGGGGAQTLDDEDDDEDVQIAAAVARNLRRPVAENPQSSAPGQPGSRALPDVEELNSSLRSTSDKGRAREAKRAQKAAKRDAAGTSGRIGFYVAILIVLLLVAAYVLNERLALALPAAEPFLVTYVALADQARLLLADGFDAVVALVRDVLKQVL